MNDVKFPEIKVKLVGEDSNAFFIIGRVSKALKAAGKKEAASEFSTAAFQCKSYDDLLQLAMRTVEVR